MRNFLVLLLVCFLMTGPLGAEDSTLFDPNPEHLWNRLNRTLFIRTAAFDGKTYLHDIDPLFFPSTRYLIAEPSHSKAIEVLETGCITPAMNPPQRSCRSAFTGRFLPTRQSLPTF